MDYRSMTLVLGIIALICGLASARFVQSPESQLITGKKPAGEIPVAGLSLSVRESLRTRSFWLLWLTWALAGAAGIAMVSLSAPFGISKGFTMQEAVLILIAFNLTNGLSRLISGHLSDIFGRNVTMALSFLAAGCAYLLMPHLEGLILLAVLAAVVGFAFGTLFAVSAPLTADCFGMKHFGAVFGLVFTAYGFLAGTLGPGLSGHLLDVTNGNFKAVFFYLGVFFFISALLIKFTKPPGRA